MNEGQRVGRRLREARVGRGFTRAQVAKKLRRNPQTLYRYETGATQPDWGVLGVLCRMYGITLASLVDPKNAKSAA